MSGPAGSSSSPAGSSSGEAQPVSQACETALRRRDQTKRRAEEEARRPRGAQTKRRADQEARRREVHSTEGTRGYGQTRRRHARADSRHVSIPCVCFRHIDTQTVSICTHCIYLHIDTVCVYLHTLPIPCSVHTCITRLRRYPLSPCARARARTQPHKHTGTLARRHPRAPARWRLCRPAEPPPSLQGGPRVSALYTPTRELAWPRVLLRRWSLKQMRDAFALHGPAWPDSKAAAGCAPPPRLSRLPTCFTSVRGDGARLLYVHRGDQRGDQCGTEPVIL
jgi:hypothetical protein